MHQPDSQRVSVRLEHDGGQPTAIVKYVPKSVVDAVSPSAHSSGSAGQRA